MQGWSRLTPLKQRQGPTPPPSGNPEDRLELNPPAETPPPPKGGDRRVARGLLAALALSGVALGIAGTAQVQLQPGEKPLIPVDQEIELGKESVTELEKLTPLWKDEAAQARLNRLGERLAQQSSRQDIPYTFKLLDSKEINAMSAPGGTIYVSRALYENYQDDDELTFILGHECGHLENYHAVRQMVKLMPSTLVGMLTGNLGGSPGAIKFGLQMLHNQMGQVAEKEADVAGLDHLIRLGIDPNKAITAMERLKDLVKDKEPEAAAMRILGDHPPTQERIDHLREVIQSRSSLR